MRPHLVAWAMLPVLTSTPAISQEPSGSTSGQESGAGWVTHPHVEIDGTQLHRIHSAIVNQDYLVKVRLPESYATGQQVYPVLFLMDGDLAFAMATDIVKYLEYG